MGCVYVLQEGRGTAFKIGYCWGSAPKARIGLLQSGNSRPLRVRVLILTQNPDELEDCFHQRFANGHIRGEWFHLTRADVAWLERYAAWLNPQFYPPADWDWQTLPDYWGAFVKQGPVQCPPPPPPPSTA